MNDDVWRVLRACAQRESRLLRCTPVYDWDAVTVDAMWHRRLCSLHGRYVPASPVLRYHRLATA